MKLSQTLISLTIASLLAACGGGGGGDAGDNNNDKGNAVPDIRDYWQLIKTDNGKTLFYEAFYNNDIIWVTSDFSTSSGKQTNELRASFDVGETFILVDNSTPLHPYCTSATGRVFFPGGYFDNFDFTNQTLYNQKPTLDDLLKTGLDFDRDGNGITDEQDARYVSASQTAPAIMNCNNQPMFGMENVVERVYYSYDQGRTWLSPRSGTKQAKFAATFEPTVDDAGGMYLPSETGLIRSDDGRDWVAIDFDERITSMINSPQTHNHLLAITETGKLYESFNNGSDWELSGQVAEDEGGFVSNYMEWRNPALAVADDGEIVASGRVKGSLRVYHSFDDGKSWRELPSPTIDPQRIIITDDYYLAISTPEVGGKKLYRLARH